MVMLQFWINTLIEKQDLSQCHINNLISFLCTQFDPSFVCTWCHIFVLSSNSLDFPYVFPSEDMIHLMIILLMLKMLLHIINLLVGYNAQKQSTCWLIYLSYINADIKPLGVLAEMEQLLVPRTWISNWVADSLHLRLQILFRPSVETHLVNLKE